MPSDLPPQTIIVAVADQASVDLDDEAAILNLKTGVYFGLNEVAARIWRLIQTPHTVGEIRAAVLDEFDVEPAALRGRRPGTVEGSGRAPTH